MYCHFAQSPVYGSARARTDTKCLNHCQTNRLNFGILQHGTSTVGKYSNGSECDAIAPPTLIEWIGCCRTYAMCASRPCQLIVFHSDGACILLHCHCCDWKFWYTACDAICIVCIVCIVHVYKYIYMICIFTTLCAKKYHFPPD